MIINPLHREHGPAPGATGCFRHGKGRLVVSVGGGDQASAMERIARAGALADLVELRLDLMADPRPEKLVPASPVPVIATVRTRTEGGAWEHGVSGCSDLLLRSLGAGARYVDVEYGFPERLRREIMKEAGAGRVILSHHTPTGTPSRKFLIPLLEAMAQEHPAVIKIVCHARTASDTLHVLSLVPRARAEGLGVSAFCMGRAGRTSRLCSLLLGASLGYSALEEGEATAEGQIPILEMRRMLQMSLAAGHGGTRIDLEETGKTMNLLPLARTPGRRENP
ncbi:MAG: type I 3-dehydroquinate dehydratase [Thermodesulfobacteriota bacterium]